MNKELVTLATQLNDARIEANKHADTAPQQGVYGYISDCLKDVLSLMFVDAGVRFDVVESIYQALLDGATVSEALKGYES